MDGQYFQQQIGFIRALPEQIPVFFGCTAMSGSYPDGDPPANTFILIDIEIEPLGALQGGAYRIENVSGDIYVVFNKGFRHINREFYQ
jgi:hypothetical protein